MPDTTPIVIVTGPPASGKSTLARAVATGACVPLLAKDDLKETLFDTLGTGDLDWSRRLGAATYALLFRVARAELEAGRSFVLEANLPAAEATGELRRLHDAHPFRALQLVCRAAPETIVDRHRRRAAQRHPGHLDRLRDEDVRAAARRPYELDVAGEVVVVETTNLAAVDAEAIVARACLWFAS